MAIDRQMSGWFCVMQGAADSGQVAPPDGSSGQETKDTSRL